MQDLSRVDLDPVISIRFDKSSSKYFEDAISAAKATPDSSGRIRVSHDESERDYHFITSLPTKARQVWGIVQGWKSSSMRILSDDLSIPRLDADEEDLRDLTYELKRSDIVDEVDLPTSDPVIEVRFGPTTSKYLRQATSKARKYDRENEKVCYEKLFPKQDSQKTGHIFVTSRAAMADAVWDIVENWKNAELRINGSRARESELETLKRKQLPACVWVLVAVLMLLSILFEVLLNT